MVFVAWSMCKVMNILTAMNSEATLLIMMSIW
jgi:hypothetical protein